MGIGFLDSLQKWCVPAILPLILHSRNGEVIPFADSKELVASRGLPPETLIEIGSDHRLADESSLSVMLWVCNLFASGKNFPGMEGEQQSSSDSSSKAKASSQEVPFVPCTNGTVLLDFA